VASVRWGEFVTICVIILDNSQKVYNISSNSNSSTDDDDNFHDAFYDYDK
jgi:hypothetical protein